MRRTSVPISLLPTIAAVIIAAISAITSATAQTTPAPGKIAFISTTCSGGGYCLAVINQDGTNLIVLTSTVRLR